MSKSEPEYIAVDKEQVEYLEQNYANAIGLFKEVSSAIVDQERKYLDGHQKYAEVVTQTIGVMAGFGFTAIGRAQSLVLFGLGELLMFASVFYSLYYGNERYRKTVDALNQSWHSSAKVLKPRVEYANELRVQAITEGRIPADAKMRIDELDANMLEKLTPPEPAPDDRLQDRTPIIILVAAVGIILILISFANPHVAVQ